VAETDVGDPLEEIERLLGVAEPGAFVLAGEMAVAYFQFHAPQSFFPTVNNGIPAVLYCFLFLYLTFAGAGPWSLDTPIARSRAEGDRHIER
jgi:putative oxidoreductase